MGITTVSPRGVTNFGVALVQSSARPRRAVLALAFSRYRTSVPSRTWVTIQGRHFTLPPHAETEGSAAKRTYRLRLAMIAIRLGLDGGNVRSRASRPHTRDYVEAVRELLRTPSHR